MILAGRKDSTASRSGARERLEGAGAGSSLGASSRRFSMGARGKRRSSRAEALAPHAAASKGSSARPSVSAPPLFPRTIYIMYDHDVPGRPAGPAPTSCQATSHITTEHCPSELMPSTTCYPYACYYTLWEAQSRSTLYTDP